jgi:P27 family predicted phage terminase small subunit
LQGPRQRKIDDRPPAHLSDQAKALWLDLLPQLKELGFWHRADALAFEMFCTSYVEWRDLTQWLRDNPRMTTNAAGECVVDPHFTACKEMAEICIELFRELGLSPMSRADILSNV